MLGDAITFPKSRDGWLRTIATGGVLLFTSVLVFPGFVLLGYLCRVIRSGITDEAKPPEFEKWEDLLVDGLKLFVIQISYGIVALIVCVLGVLSVTVLSPRAARAFQTQPTDPVSNPPPDLSLVDVGVLLVIFLLVFVIMYVSLAAIARFAHKDHIRAAFQIRAVVRTAFTSEFFVGFVLFVTIGLVLGALSIALSGLIVGLFFTFYTFVVAFYLIGRGYRNANARRTHTDAWAA